MVHWLVAAFVGANMETLVEKLADLGINTINSNLRSENELLKLSSTLHTLQSSIHEAVDTQMRTDQAWKPLLRKFEDLRYHVDDLLNEFVSEVPRARHLSNQTIEAVQRELEDMLNKLDRIQARPPDKKLQTTSFIDKSRVFGRDTDITNLLAMLQPSEASSTAGNVSVIPILGVIGVGKTTLARLAYNCVNSGNPNGFHIKIWVSVPVNFDVTSVTRSIIEEANRQSDSKDVNPYSLSNLESLQHQLVAILRGKKFLLVLDDLWNVKRDEWNLLLNLLNHALGGSKIIITTGSRVVSQLVATAEPYELNCLSSEDCCKMIKQEACGHANVYGNKREEEIGLEIARKCEGLPLAAKIFVGQLRWEYNVCDWENVMKKKVWDLSAFKSEAASALQWGFHRLPLRVRQCFEYCSMFPQSYEFEKHKMIRMWMGGGLIIFEEENTPDEIGSRYIDQLFENSFIGKNGKNFKIQDSVHKLVQSVSSPKFSVVEETCATSTNESTQHLSLHCDNIETVIPNVYKCKGLRSLILFVRNPFDGAPLALFGLRRLRVLDFSGTQIKDLTGSIGNLIHLRFLDLSNTRLKLLPETIKELRALQTLIITNNPNLLRLPDSICKLINLLHLQLGGNNLLSAMPCGIGKLIGLRAIDRFIVGSKRGQINELKNLNNIQGSLCITQLENVEDTPGDLDADLASKRNLDSLELQWSFVDDGHKSALVLGKLEAPDSLKQLFFSKYGGMMFPQWVSKRSFSELVAICMEDCENCELLPSMGKLPKLKSLIISGMHKLKVWNEHLLGKAPVFPSLETLEFHDVPILEEWVGVRENDMACLRRLVLVDCPQLVNIPSLHYFRCLEELKFEDCPMLPLLTEEVLSSSVKSLYTKNCSLLENCYKEGGVDRIKIEHIPIIQV